MTRFSSSIIPCFAFFLFSSLYNNVSAAELSLSELYRLAHENSPRLEMAHTDISIEQERLGALKSGYYPTLSLGYNSEYNKRLDQSGASNASIGDTMIYEGNTYEDSLSLRFNYELYHFGVTDKSVDIQNKEIAIKHTRVCLEENRLQSEILESYAEALKSHTQIVYQSTILTIRKKLYTDLERLVNAGRESRMTLSDQAIAIINLERDIEQSRLRYDDAITKLSELSGLVLQTSELTLSPITATAPISDLAFEETASAKEYQQKIEQKHLEIRRRSLMEYPTLSMYGNYYLYGSDDNTWSSSFNDIRPNSWNAGLSVRFELFSGFKSLHETQLLRLEKSRLESEQLLKKQEYDSALKASTLRREHLDRMSKQESELVLELEQKVKHQDRLRRAGESDEPSLLSARIEEQERRLSLSIEQIQSEYEKEKIRLAQITMDECQSNISSSKKFKSTLAKD